MARPQKIKINVTLLDKNIRDNENGNFNQAKISKFVMGKGDTYYSEMLKNGTVAEEVLDRVCEYYDLSKEDYIVTKETVQKEIQQKADTQNYENLIVLLTGIDKSLKEILAQQKSTNFLLGELKTNATNDNKFSKEIIQKLENLEKRQQKYGKYN